MYRILLLHDKGKGACRVKDYLLLSGCHVVECALKQAFEIDVLLRKTDAVLLNGNEVELYFEICGQIREQTQIPVIILSENNDEWMKIKMFQMGVDDYLPEPFPQGELLARLRSHIERYKRLTRPFGIIRKDSLEINSLSRTVRVSGREIFFRAKEFEVLLYLAQNPNKVLTKEEIYSEIWGDDLGGGYFNSVAVHVKRIREKIEEDPENPQFIVTIWGVGYLFKM